MSALAEVTWTLPSCLEILRLPIAALCPPTKLSLTGSWVVTGARLLPITRGSDRRQALKPMRAKRKERRGNGQSRRLHNKVRLAAVQRWTLNGRDFCQASRLSPNALEVLEDAGGMGKWLCLGKERECRLSGLNAASLRSLGLSRCF